jgi:molybdopterin synthase sulfur carrier subunit
VLTVRYFAGARAAAGISQERLPGAATLAELTTLLTQRHGQRLATVLTAATFLVDGQGWRELDRPLPAQAVVDVLPPFAGG